MFRIHQAEGIISNFGETMGITISSPETHKMAVRRGFDPLASHRQCDMLASTPTDRYVVGCLGNDPRTYGVKARCVANYTNNPLKLGGTGGQRSHTLPVPIRFRLEPGALPIELLSQKLFTKYFGDPNQTRRYTDRWESWDQREEDTGGNM